MRFKKGKTYRHTTGKTFTVIGKLKTRLYGKTLIAETNKGELLAVGSKEEHAVNYEKV